MAGDESTADAVARRLTAVERSIRGSGDPDRIAMFDARVWLARSLSRPHPAFGGHPPAAMITMSKGADRVLALRSQQSDAYW